MEQRAETKNKNLPIVFLLTSLTTLLVLRVLPIFKSPLSTYGYDYGFYLYAAEHAQTLRLSSWLTVLWGGYNNPLFYLAHVLRVPPGVMLNEAYFAAVIFAGVGFYFLLKRFSWQAGALACALFGLSLVQTEGYLMFLWKNILALPFLLLGFYFFTQKRFRPWLICSLLIFLTHRTTAIIYALTLSMYGIYWLIKHKKYFLLIGFGLLALIMVLCGFYFLNLKSLILNLISNNNYYVRTGLFLENQNLFALWWPYLLLALPGMWLYLKRREHWLLPIFAGLCLTWIFLHLPFYRRVLFYLVLAVIYFASYFLGQID